MKGDPYEVLYRKRDTSASELVQTQRWQERQGIAERQRDHPFPSDSLWYLGEIEWWEKDSGLERQRKMVLLSSVGGDGPANQVMLRYKRGI